jgi:hypothetical protein
MRTLLISGIQCEIGEDENGFIDVFIEHPDGRVFGLPTAVEYSEWIVRGALTKKDAILLASDLIKERLLFMTWKVESG